VKIAENHQAHFITTHWSLVLSTRRNGPESVVALERLCQMYWPPLYAYVRRDGLTPHDAQDVVQDFIAHLLERDDLQGLSPEAGRFRSFLLAALKNFLISRVRREQAAKRGGGKEIVRIDADEAEKSYASEITHESTPAQAFDRRWARSLMTRAFERLKAEHRSPQQARMFAALQSVLLEGGRLTQQATLAAELGVTPGSLAVAATRLRQRFRALIEDEIRQTLANPADLDEEMRALRAAWV
jgi:RNA polymerase sigma factor (sigma-70 family)